eukprot:TRINITY_DN5549_c0_g3_i1.p1 TRINITY_DN5549_c0_g3~~TRINITY_DN5549_c0_g3_i1.p1  ORF type:complete len:250 (-),score=67.61 TRINITY_DN5549_c0_g3_i1:5-754(-)
MPLLTLLGDLISEILAYMNDSDLCNLRLVSTSFLRRADADDLWKSRFCKVFGPIGSNANGDWKARYIYCVARSWDPEFRCDGVTLKNFNRRAIHSDDEGWESVQIRKGLTTGKHYFEVKTSGRLTFGIASKDFSFNSEKNMGGENVISYGYASNGNYARPNERWKVQVAEKFKKKDDTIGMLVDLDNHVLTFWKGHVKQPNVLEIEKRYRMKKWYVTATMFDDSSTTIELTPNTKPPTEMMIVEDHVRR